MQNGLTDSILHPAVIYLFIFCHCCCPHLSALLFRLPDDHSGFEWLSISFYLVANSDVAWQFQLFFKSTMSLLLLFFLYLSLLPPLVFTLLHDKKNKTRCFLRIKLSLQSIGRHAYDICLQTEQIPNPEGQLPCFHRDIMSQTYVYFQLSSWLSVRLKSDRVPPPPLEQDGVLSEQFGGHISLLLTESTVKTTDTWHQK